MVQLKLLIFTLTFYEVVVDLDAITCPKGHKVNSRGTGCEVCPDGYYQHEPNPSQMCQPCTKCEEDRGSVVIRRCTRDTNTECQCRRGFVPRGSHSSTCKCEIGFGLKNSECLQCEEGYFSTTINSHCQKWTDCISGVKVNGTRTSDVICNEMKRNPYITTHNTPCSASSCQHETSTPTKQTTTTTASSTHTATRRTRELTPSNLNTGNHIGIALLIVGVFGMLVLTAVTCKLHITPCVQRKPGVQTRESLCRRPIEESGGDGSQSSLKLNPGEP